MISYKEGWVDDEQEKKANSCWNPERAGGFEGAHESHLPFNGRRAAAAAAVGMPGDVSGE